MSRSLTFLFLLCFSCTRTPPHMATGYKIIHQHQNAMSLLGWIPQSVGGSFSLDDIKVLNSSFMIIADHYDVNKTREQIVLGAKKFLDHINNIEAGKKHLNHFPFTYQDLDYSLMICDQEGKLLGHTFLMFGDVMFSEADEFGHLQRIHEETFPEALDKVQGALMQAHPKAVEEP